MAAIVDKWRAAAHPASWRSERPFKKCAMVAECRALAIY
jgi:hypothetical protein